MKYSIRNQAGTKNLTKELFLESYLLGITIHMKEPIPPITIINFWTCLWIPSKLWKFIWFCWLNENHSGVSRLKILCPQLISSNPAKPNAIAKLKKRHPNILRLVLIKKFALKTEKITDTKYVILVAYSTIPSSWIKDKYASFEAPKRILWRIIMKTNTIGKTKTTRCNNLFLFTIKQCQPNLGKLKRNIQYYQDKLHKCDQIYLSVI